MKLRECKPGVIYRVTNGGSGATLKKGDSLWINDRGQLNLPMVGWLDPGDWERLRATVEVDRGYYERRIESLKQEIGQCRSILREHERQLLAMNQEDK